MTFDEWHQAQAFNAGNLARDRSLMQMGWVAATAAERARYAKLVEAARALRRAYAFDTEFYSQDMTPDPEIAAIDAALAELDEGEEV